MKPIDKIDLSLYDVVADKGCLGCDLHSGNGGPCLSDMSAHDFGCILNVCYCYKLKRENKMSEKVVGTCEIVYGCVSNKTIDLEDIPTGQRFTCSNENQVHLYVKVRYGAARISDGLHWNTGGMVYNYRPVSVKIEVSDAI